MDGTLHATWTFQRVSRREPISEKHAQRLLNIVHAFAAELLKLPAEGFFDFADVQRMVVGDLLYFSAGFRRKMGSVLFCYSGLLLDRVIERRGRRVLDTETKESRRIPNLSVEDLRNAVVESAGSNVWDDRYEVLRCISGRSIPTGFLVWLLSPYVADREFMVDLFGVLLSLTRRIMLVHLPPLAHKRPRRARRERLYIREHTLVDALSPKLQRDGSSDNPRSDPLLSEMLLRVDVSNPGTLVNTVSLTHPPID